MAITYPLELPSTGDISEVDIVGRNTVAITKSPFTGEQQVHEHPAKWWEVTLTLKPMKAEDAEKWIAFELKMKGKRGTVLAGDPTRKTPRGSASSNAGTPQVKGSTHTGDNLIVDGLPGGTTGYLLPGDYIQLGSSNSSKLYKILDPVDTSTAGESTFSIWPDLRSSPSDNETVTVSNAKGTFRLASNEQNWTIRVNKIYRIVLPLMEDL